MNFRLVGYAAFAYLASASILLFMFATVARRARRQPRIRIAWSKYALAAPDRAPST